MKKNELIQKVTGFRGCSSCGDIPDIQLSYDLQSASKIERYCDKCAKTVFEREKTLPVDKKALAEYYGCEKGIVPHYQPSYHNPAQIK